MAIPEGVAPAPTRPTTVPKFAVIKFPVIEASGAGSTIPRVACATFKVLNVLN